MPGRKAGLHSTNFSRPGYCPLCEDQKLRVSQEITSSLPPVSTCCPVHPLPVYQTSSGPRRATKLQSVHSLLCFCDGRSRSLHVLRQSFLIHHSFPNSLNNDFSMPAKEQINLCGTYIDFSTCDTFFLISVYITTYSRSSPWFILGSLILHGG